MEGNVHDKHRERVRKEFLSSGFDENTPPHKVMEMLLFYCLPRKDTNATAHALIDRFGSVSRVLDATPAQLKSVPGIGENAAAFLHMLPQLFRIYHNDRSRLPQIFAGIDDIGDFLLLKYLNYNEELFGLTSLTKTGKLLGFDILERGDIDSVGISIRRLVETVIERRAGCIVVSHNHPSGIALPSGEDIAITEQIIQATKPIGVPLIDHLILVENDYVSLAQSPKYRHLFRSDRQE